MARVRTAIIGLGYFGPNLLRNFAAQPDCEMVMACDLNPAALVKVQQQYPTIRGVSDAQEIFSDTSIELVIIATPTTAHFPLAKAALEAGKHVLIEKPMTATLEEGRELVALAKKQGKVICVDHTFCFAPAVQKLKALKDEGRLGELLYFDSVRINLGLIQRDADVLQDLAVHDFSILGQLLPLTDVRSVCTHGSKHFGEHAEQAHIHVVFGSGATAHIHVSWLSPVKIRRTMVAGTTSMALYDDTEPSEKIRIYDRGIDRAETQKKDDPFFPKYRNGDILIPALPALEPLALEAKHVLACVQGVEKPIVSGEDALKVLELLEHCRTSLQQNAKIITL